MSQLTSYMPQLDGLRAIATIMVFLHHAYSVPLLWTGVDLFFVMSGCLITNVLIRDLSANRLCTVLGKFYVRRAQRLVPAYVLALVLITAFGGLQWFPLWPYYVFFCQNIPYAFHLIPFGPLVPLWSLAVEQHFYLVWPLLCAVLPRRLLVWFLCGVLILTPVLRVIFTPTLRSTDAIYALTPFRIDAMAAGALVSLTLPGCSYLRAVRWAKTAILLGGAMYVVFGLNPAFRRGADSLFFNGVAYSLNILIFGGLLVWAIVVEPQHPMAMFLSSRPMRALGRISYAFYLFHLLVLSRVGPHLPRGIAPPLCFVFTTCLARLSWYTVEKPVLRQRWCNVGPVPSEGSSR